jgi:prolyl oligopeptidase
MTDGPSDPYEWLEDAGSPLVLAWTAAQKSTYEAAARRWVWRDTVSERLADLSAASGTVGSPRPVAGRLFVTRLESRAEHPQLLVVEPDGTFRVLLDPVRIDPSGATTLERWDCSWDGGRLAYQLASGGTEQSTLYVLDVETGTVIDGPIDRVRRSSIAWLGDGSGYFYVRATGSGSAHYDRRVYLHRIGAKPDDDVLVFGEGRESSQFYAVRTSPDGRWLTISAGAGTAPRRDVWLADLATSAPELPALRVLQIGVDARTTVHLPHGIGPADRCYLVTDLAAPRGRLVTCTPSEPDPRNWHDLVPTDTEAVFEDFAVLDGDDLDRPVLVVVRTRHAVSEVTVHDAMDGTWLATLDLPPCVTVGPLRAEPVRATEVWFTVTGFTIPPQVYRYDAISGQLEAWPATDPARPAGSDITTRQVAFESADGTTVRMFVLATSAEPDRPQPAILTGYGGFGQSLTPVYSLEAIAWVEAGGVYAVANIRGGGEEGEQWHRAGAGDHKQNSFADFEAAADHLVSAGWTTTNQLGIWGASNGGLLVGAAITRQPQRYRAAVCLAPLLDMFVYEQTGMGPSWVDEYGSADDPEQARWLQSYSPYQHVRSGTPYPATMFAVFDGDTRVDPLHARKMCAAMTDATSVDRPLLYRLERGAGHGSRAASQRTALLADLLSFFADQLGLPVAARHRIRPWTTPGIPAPNHADLASTTKSDNVRSLPDRRRQ